MKKFIREKEHSEKRPNKRCQVLGISLINLRLQDQQEKERERERQNTTGETASDGCTLEKLFHLPRCIIDQL